MTLTADQLGTYRAALNTERARILLNIEALHAELHESLSNSTEENGLETHIGDQGTMTFLRERDLSIEEHEEHILESIDGALKRVDAGSYGVCADCGTDIPADRLEALPWAERCITCQEHAGS